MTDENDLIPMRLGISQTVRGLPPSQLHILQEAKENPEKILRVSMPVQLGKAGFMSAVRVLKITNIRMG